MPSQISITLAAGSFSSLKSTKCSVPKLNASFFLSSLLLRLYQMALVKLMSSSPIQIPNSLIEHLLQAAESDSSRWQTTMDAGDRPDP